MKYVVIASAAAAGCLISFALLYGPSDVRAQAPLGAGEICFEVGGSGGLLVRMAFSDMGNGHYFLTGRVTDPQNIEFVEPIFGNAEVYRGSIYLTMLSARSSVGTDPVGGGWMTAAVLDPGTLSGTVESFGVEHDTDDGMTRLDYGEIVPISRISCP